jgi:hypothetical protein
VSPLPSRTIANDADEDPTFASVITSSEIVGSDLERRILERFRFGEVLCTG